MRKGVNDRNGADIDEFAKLRSSMSLLPIAPNLANSWPEVVWRHSSKLLAHPLASSLKVQAAQPLQTLAAKNTPLLSSPQILY
jgi:hypothetical protein